MLALLGAIDHAQSHAEVAAERALLAALGGTCHSPVAVLCRHADGALAMRAVLFSEDGSARVERSATFPVDDRQAPARLARELLTAADPAIVRLFTGAAG
jgi:hydroxymethylbilane synthase